MIAAWCIALSLKILSNVIQVQRNFGDFLFAFFIVITKTVHWFMRIGLG